jgi:hypothetical protein
MKRKHARPVPTTSSLKSTREVPGFHVVASADFLEKLSAHLREEESRIGEPCSLQLVGPLDDLPQEAWRTFWAQPSPILQLVDGPLDGDWAIPMLGNETVLAHAPIAAPFTGVAGFIVRPTDLSPPQFDDDARERIASALADALLAGERLR